ncbi:MAG: hypothetical protein K2P99_03650, partial [Burkholderiales bacterium]|nr:hypothetical protein [Burkholderiales bacterium]
MLKNIIKSIITSKSSIFFDLFEETSKNAYRSAGILLDILNANGVNELSQACINARIFKQKSNDVHKRVLQALNKMFITPIDR